MERPSHSIFDTYPNANASRRLPLLGMALCLQAAALWLFTHGLMSQLIPIVHGPIELVPIVEKTNHDPLPPPEPHWQKPKPVTAEKPIINIDRGPGDPPIHGDPPGTKQVSVINPPVSPDRMLVGIVSTHTVPPYPPIARRIGAEGKVVLRLTVSPEGRVTVADIVTSSGRADMDEAAQQWIVAHWRYKPAVSEGAAAVSHTLASVTFSLVNEH